VFVSWCWKTRGLFGFRSFRIRIARVLPRHRASRLRVTRGLCFSTQNAGAAVIWPDTSSGDIACTSGTAADAFGCAGSRGLEGAVGGV